MSGSNSRYKTRKQKNTAEDPLISILRQIAERGEVCHEDILELYRINRPTCDGCRVNNKDSPNCFCALIPPPGGSRKSGTIWQKRSDVESKLGPDPGIELRPSLESPSGLTNLGATCYVNSVLQCLYRVKPFIQGFFSAEPDLFEEQAVLQNLALLFGELQYGRKRAVDSAPLANVLGLNNSIQQDGQEFLKLLLSSLERLLGLSTNPKARTVVKDVFCGTLSHVTRCSKCGQESGASKDLVDFYELELNVKGLSSLDQSLDDYLSIEQLTGDNQFFCESCNTSVDASRFCKLRSLPPVLTFQLKRFVFDAKTATKKKVTSKFTFPDMLDMSSRLSADGLNGKQRNSGANLTYELAGILIHKGNTANSGHYVAHIKDDTSGEWWEFDDDMVSSLGSHPFGETPETPKKSGKVSSIHEKSSEATSSAMLTSQDDILYSNVNHLTSADAYMLIYNLRELSKSTNSSSGNLFNLPSKLYHQIELQNKQLEDSCEHYKAVIEKEVSDRAERKDEINTILSSISVGNIGDKFFWISSNWLKTWADELDPFEIDNTELLCQHNKVTPVKIGSMKRISEEAWSKLVAKYGGGPTITGDDCCTECIMEDAKNFASASSYKSERTKIRQIIESAGTSGEHNGGYYVSKTWLQNWLRRKTVEGPSDFDASPTSSITCCHKSLLPESFPGAKRQAVTEEVWQYFMQIAQKVHVDSNDGCINFPVGTPTCSVCEAELNEAANQHLDLMSMKMEERQKHQQLFSGDSIPLLPGSKYYLVPLSWVQQWRLYVGGTGKKAQKIDEPLDLGSSLQNLLCQKHGGILFKPPRLQKTRRGDFVQIASNDDKFLIVSNEDWTGLCEKWNANPSQAIEAIVPEPPKNPFDNSEETVPIDGSEDVQNEKAVPILQTEPEACNICISERESTELIMKLQYFDEDIYIEMVEGKEPPKSLLDPPKGDRRVSKRARRTPASTNKRIVIKVSGETTLNQLKLQIWESLSIVKENQRLHFGKKELTDDLATLSDLNILPGSLLWVMDTGEHENRDIAEEFYNEDSKKPLLEEGFSGTLLARLPNLAESLSMKETNKTISGSEAKEKMPPEEGAQFCRRFGSD